MSGALTASKSDLIALVNALGVPIKSDTKLNGETSVHASARLMWRRRLRVRGRLLSCLRQSPFRLYACTHARLFLIH